MMRIRSNYRGSVPSRGGPPSGSSIIATFDQWWSRGLVVRYWLFDSWYTARKEAIWIGTRIGAGVHLQSESNPEDVIGDATWYHVDQKSGEKVWAASCSRKTTSWSWSVQTTQQICSSHARLPERLKPKLRQSWRKNEQRHHQCNRGELKRAATLSSVHRHTSQEPSVS